MMGRELDGFEGGERGGDGWAGYKVVGGRKTQGIRNLSIPSAYCFSHVQLWMGDSLMASIEKINPACLS